MTYCNRCPFNGTGSEHCIHCRQEEQYSYKFNKYILPTYNPPQPDTSGSEKCTPLSEDAEDQLRKFLYVLFDLTYNEICVLKGIMTGKSLTAIAKDIQANALANRTVSRHKVFQERKSMLKKLGDTFAPALMTSGQRRKLKA